MLTTPYAGWTDLRVWLALQMLVITVFLWIMWGRAWRREPPGFIWRTFLDDRGVPDGKQLAICHALSVMTITMVVGWVANRWPPYYVWISWDFIAIAGIFGAVYVTKKYYENGGSTEPHPDFGLPGATCPPETEQSGVADESTTSSPAAGGPGSM